MSDPLDQVQIYHRRTKHHFHAYARSLGYLDWATQPDPFRRYRGASVIELDKTLPGDTPLYEAAFVAGLVPLYSMLSITSLINDSVCGISTR